jgi:hypothetical protein
VKATVSGVFEDLKFKISEGSDQKLDFTIHTLIPNLVKPLTYILYNKENEQEGRSEVLFGPDNSIEFLKHLMNIKLKT